MNPTPSAEGWLAISPAAGSVRRDLGAVAWVVLEELAARADPHTAYVSANVRDVASRLGIGKDTVACAMRRLRSAGLVVAAGERGSRGRFGAGRYALRTDGLIALAVGARRVTPHPSPVPPSPATPDMVTATPDDPRAAVESSAALQSSTVTSRRSRSRAAALPVGVQLDLLAVADSADAGLAVSVPASAPKDQP